MWTWATLTHDGQPAGQYSGSGNLSIQAMRNITFTGTNVTAGQDLSLSAGQDLQVGSQQATQRIATGFYTYNNTQNINSTLQGGNNVTLVAQQNVNLSGVPINGTNSITIAAGGNVNLTAVKNSTYQDVQTGNASHGDYFHNQTNDETVIGSNLQSNGNIQCCCWKYSRW